MPHLFAQVDRCTHDVLRIDGRASVEDVAHSRDFLTQCFIRRWRTSCQLFAALRWRLL